jgi:Predicted dehydrogenases and related proteins
MLRIAVIGLGHPHIFSMIEEVLAQKESFEIVAICDSDSPENVKKAKDLVPDAKVYNDLDELFLDNGFDAVLSSAIFSKKSDLAVRSLKAHKHIMFDKPLSTTMEGLNEIEKELSLHPDLKIALWLTERYSPTYYTAKKLIDQGAIGEIVHMYFVRPHRLAPESRPAWLFDRQMYGGILNDIGVHDFDLARWFTGSECAKIDAAHVSTKRFTEYSIEDNGSVMMTMENGATCMIFENWLTPEKFPIHGDTRATIYGTRGQIEVKAYPESVTLFSDTKEPQEIALIPPPYTSAEDFLKVISDPQHTALVSTKDACFSTRLALLAQQKAMN